MSFEIQFTADDGAIGEPSTITVVHEAAPVPRIGELVAFNSNLRGTREVFEVFDVEWEVYEDRDANITMRAHVHCAHWSGKGHLWHQKP